MSIEVFTKTDRNITYTLIFCFFAIFVYAFFHDYRYESVCINETTVIDIVELKGRDADILLSNGDIVSVNQAWLKVGDKQCLEYEFVLRD